MSSTPEQGREPQVHLPEEFKSNLINEATNRALEGDYKGAIAGLNFLRLAEEGEMSIDEFPAYVEAGESEQPASQERPVPYAHEQNEPSKKSSIFSRFGESLRGSKLGTATAIGLAAVAGFVAANVTDNGGNKTPINPESARADDGGKGAAAAHKKRENKGDNQNRTKAQREVARVRNRGNVPAAVEELDSAGQKDLKDNARKAIQGKYGEKRLIHDNAGGDNQMNSLFTEFDPDTIGVADAVEGVAFGIGSSDAYAAASYNALMGNPVSENLPAGVSMQEARDALARQMTGENARSFINNNKSGTYMNHGQNGEDVFEAGFTELHNERVLVIETESGRKLRYKIDGGSNSEDNICLNILTPAEVTVTVPGSPTTPTTPGTPSTPSNPNTPTTPGTPSTPSNPNTPSTPSNPNTPNNPSNPGKPEKPEKPRHKPADGPPKEAVQHREDPGRTEGYEPGNAEEVVGQQESETPGGLDPTDYGTEAGGPGSSPGGGDESVESEPAPSAPDNPEYDPGSESEGTDEGTSDPAPTEGSDDTSGAGTNPGLPGASESK